MGFYIYYLLYNIPQNLLDVVSKSSEVIKMDADTVEKVTTRGTFESTSEDIGSFESVDLLQGIIQKSAAVTADTYLHSSYDF